MPELFTAPELPVAFAQVPKSGCSSVKMAMWQAIDRARGVQTYAGVPHQRPGPWDSQGDAKAAGKETFAVVRNPFARLYSAYWSKLVLPSAAPPGPEGRWRHHLRLLGFETDPGFAAFVEAVAATAPAQMDKHWAPQSFLLSVPVDHLFRLEQAQALSDYLVRRIGVPLGAWRASAYAVPMRAAYTPALVALAGDIYAEDFARFGYARTLEGGVAA